MRKNSRIYNCSFNCADLKPIIKNEDGERNIAFCEVNIYHSSAKKIVINNRLIQNKRLFLFILKHFPSLRIPQLNTLQLLQGYFLLCTILIVEIIAIIITFD
jgi:hypothetical protein